MMTLDCEIKELTLLQGAKFLRAYLECSDDIQAGIRDMLEIIHDPNTDNDDRNMALSTLADALFPNPHEGQLGMDLEESEKHGAEYSEEMRITLEAMDQEEKNFADRLRHVMEQQKITQEDLAARIHVGQPAISNMLNRQCRPQRRTVYRLAESLGISPEELWPGIANPTRGE